MEDQKAVGANRNSDYQGHWSSIDWTVIIEGLIHKIILDKVLWPWHTKFM